MRNYERTTTRQSWDEDNMRKAIQAVNDGTMGYLKAAETYEVPKSTLERRVKKFRQNKDLNSSTCKGLGRYKRTFSNSEEKRLTEDLLFMESRLYFLTYEDVRRLAFQHAEANNIDHPFDRKSKLAGKDWLTGFMKRNPKLTLRSPMPTSMTKTMELNSVRMFFDSLQQLIDEYKFPSTKIYNVDEIVLTEEGQLTTAILCICADGNNIPPVLISPNIRRKKKLLDGAPPGTILVSHPSGLIQNESFIEWLNHFIASVKPKKDNPVLLLLNGSSSYTKNLPFINKAKENGVIILSFPPHCTHILQPLDVSVKGPMITYYTQKVNMWLEKNRGKLPVATLFEAAYCKAATKKNAVSGFSMTGIFPINRNIFGKTGLPAVETTEVHTSTPSSSTDTYIKPTTIAPPIDIMMPSPSAPVVDPNPAFAAPSTPPTLNLVQEMVSPVQVTPVPKTSRGLKRTTEKYKKEIDISPDKIPKLDHNELSTTKNKTTKSICLDENSASDFDNGWVQCTCCKNWVHEGCTGLIEPKNFTCSECNTAFLREHT